MFCLCKVCYALKSMLCVKGMMIIKECELFVKARFPMTGIVRARSPITRPTRARSPIIRPTRAHSPITRPFVC